MADELPKPDDPLQQTAAIETNFIKRTICETNTDEHASPTFPILVKTQPNPIETQKVPTIVNSE